MISTIKIKIPYPQKIGFVRLYLRRLIGFSFDQLALLRLLENNDIDLPNYSEWIKKSSHSTMFGEMIFAAAQSYSMGVRVKDNFTKEKLILGFQELKEDDQKRIIEAWTKSETFGSKKMPGKKKAANL